jgi:2-keto-3-deoxy-L-fuconate dehydrogenase
MSNRLSKKNVLVTAAAQGIGEAIARACAAEGATVLATDVNVEKLQHLAEVPSITVQPLDVTEQGQVDAVVGSAGTLDVLCNCAGFVHHGSILDCGEADWDFSFELNVKSMYRTIRAALPAMRTAGGGSIVNIASVASSVRGIPNRFAYGASKAAVIGLTKSVAADFVTEGIRCNAICPGTVQSPSLDERIAALGGDQAVARKAFVERQPMGRLGTAEEIAAIAVYLASDESQFTTGTTMLVDGGMCI